MNDRYKEDIEKFELELTKVPESHKPNVVNLFVGNMKNLQQIDNLAKDINLPIRYAIKRTSLVHRSSKKLEKYLKLSDCDGYLFFQTYSHLKKFVRKNRAIVKNIEQLSYNNSYFNAAPHDNPWYLLSYIENKNILNYYAQYLPLFKKEDGEEYVPRKFPIKGIPYK